MRGVGPLLQLLDQRDMVGTEADQAGRDRRLKPFDPQVLVADGRDRHTRDADALLGGLGHQRGAQELLELDCLDEPQKRAVFALDGDGVRNDDIGQTSADRRLDHIHLS